MHKYLHVKIASSGNVKFCVTIYRSNYGKCLALYILSVDYPLSLSCLTEDTSMITVSSSGVKLQISSLACIKYTICGFSQHSFIHSFIYYFFFTWDVIGM